MALIGREPKKGLINWEIAVYAVYLKGGTSKFVHTEDVALKSFELVPDAFSWIRHPQLPDKDIVRVALTDARKARVGGFVAGRAGRGLRQPTEAPYGSTADGWRLTEAGVRWVLENQDRLRDATGAREAKNLRQEVLQKLSRLTNHRLFASFKHDVEHFSPSIGELADLLRCRVDADATVWSKRLDTYRNQAELAARQDLLLFLTKCGDAVARLSGS